MIGLAGLLLTGLGWIAQPAGGEQRGLGGRADQRQTGQDQAGRPDRAGRAGDRLADLHRTHRRWHGTGRPRPRRAGHRLAGAGTLTAALGIILALAGDMVIFWWLLVRLPRVTVPRGVLLRGALLASVGFEVLKLMGTWYIAQVNKSPAAGVFGSVIGILVWLYLVARYLLFCAAWTATALPSPRPLTPGLVPPPGPAHRAASARALAGHGRGLLGGDGRGDWRGRRCLADHPTATWLTSSGRSTRGRPAPDS